MFMWFGDVLKSGDRLLASSRRVSLRWPLPFENECSRYRIVNFTAS